jgi:phosphate transport system substrate-binding protein
LLDIRGTRRAAVALTAVLALAACGTGGTAATAGGAGTPTAPAGTTAPGTTAPTGEALSGSIVVSGSSTVLPITAAIADDFDDQNRGVAITVEGPGTGDGFKRFCNGETDISNASRAIKDEEARSCADKGIEFVELKVAIDGLTVMTGPENDAVDCLSFADLYALIGPEAGGIENWKDAQAVATELGSTTQLPDAPLSISGPGEESGTYDSFVELVIAGFAEARGKEAGTRKDYQSSGQDPVIIQGISGTALGWVGYAVAEENQGSVKLLAVDEKGDGTCVEPTADTIASGEYPIARDLYIYVSKDRLATNPALAPFVDYYLAEGTLSSVLEEVPYVNLTDEALNESRAAWAAGKGS